MRDSIVDGVQQVIAWCFYAIGRGTTRLIGLARSNSGMPEALLGFAVVVLVVLAVIRLPGRLLAHALVR